ncbi:unnamed protein product [Linum trigynum]|uniref:Uncharacterized protein n=1 Tax=Linum trigynum TaxID=586398 RepID=A0AAV2DW64_9ROSI
MMPGYDTEGPVMNDGPEMVGGFVRDANGLGWLGLDGEAEDDGLNLVGRPANPMVYQRGSGPGRVADPVEWGPLLSGGPGPSGPWRVELKLGRPNLGGPEWGGPKVVEPS